jgi:hypothetical protein
VVLAGTEHRDDVSGAVGGGEGREGRADEKEEGGEESARVGGGAPASGHSGGPVVAGVGSGQPRRTRMEMGWRQIWWTLLGLRKSWPCQFGPPNFQPN